MAGAKLTMKNPGSAVQRIFGPESKAPPAPSGGPDAEDAGETYHLSADALKELNETGTAHCDEGCTITADIGGGEDEAGEGAAEAPPAPM